MPARTDRHPDDPDEPVSPAMGRHPSGRRRLLLPGLVLVGALVAVLAVTTSGGGAATPAAGHADHAHGTTVSARELAFRQDMRALWEDHVAWTRLAIVDFAASAPSLDATMARLLRNQTDIGAAIVPYYGTAAGRKLTALLREHILIAVDVLAAARAGDGTRLADAQTRWARNADRIAAFLARANPRHWKPAEMRAMMWRHLGLTTAEAVARLGGDWSADVRAADMVHAQARVMADMLSNGIVAQFPRRF